MNVRRKSFLGLAAVILATVLFLLTPPIVGAWNNNVVVETAYGTLQGSLSSDKSTMIWKGVPYAKPPIDALRWKAPQNPEPWSGVHEAINPAPKCTQLFTTDDWLRTGAVDSDSSEDCLYVDIYRPNNSERLPVYVWIHGGSNNFGSARQYDGTNIANRSDVVVVVVQYRLGPIGWFYHPALQSGTDPLSDSGNFGTLDNAQALKWIRENIAAFGGDSHNVTITGESAGAHNVMNMVISPLGNGLFSQAMSESGGMVTVSTVSGRNSANDYIQKLIRYKENVDAATAMARRIAMETDGTLESYLRSTNAGDFFLAILKYGSLPVFPAIEDGKVMPLGGWIPAIKAGNYNKVPIILGSNEYEMKSFMPLYFSFVTPFGVPSTVPTYTWFSLFTSARNNNNPNLEAVLPKQFDKDLYEKSGYFGSRYWKAKFVDSVALELSKVQDKVYAYLFKWGGIGSGPYPFDFIYGAGHASEIPFFFGGDQGLFNIPFVPDNEKGRKELQNAMMAYLSNFARTGNPNSGDPNQMFPPNNTKWLQWSNAPGDPKAIVFDGDFNQAKITMTNEEVTFTGVDAERGEWINQQSDDFWVNYLGFIPLSQKQVAGYVTGMFQFHFPW